MGKGCRTNGYEKYELIAKASSGQVFHLDEASDIYEVLFIPMKFECFKVLENIIFFIFRH